MSKGKLIFTTNKKGKQILTVLVDDQELVIPDLDINYVKKQNNGKPCEVAVDKGKATSVKLDGKELIKRAPAKVSTAPISAPSKLQGPGHHHAGGGTPTPSHAPPVLKSTADRNHVLLPEATKAVLDQAKEVSHFGLKYSKFAWHGSDGKFKLLEKDNYCIDAKFDAVLIKELGVRQKASVSGLCPRNMSLELASGWRVATGLGVESVYETGLTLHHTYGFPFLPGQTIKGVVRSYVIVKYFAGEEKPAMSDPGFASIFGCDEDGPGGQARRGGVIFFDGLPAAPPKMAVDIMTPHFGEYYKDGKSPGEYYDPVPVQFLTVENLKINFWLGLLPRMEEAVGQGLFKEKKALNLVSGWLKDALTENGIGAKTAVGYGRMA